MLLFVEKADEEQPTNFNQTPIPLSEEQRFNYETLMTQMTPMVTEAAE